MEVHMKIGELAKRSGVSIDAIRYYERNQVLPRAERTASGYRLFGEEAVVRLDLVRRLQDLGFTLDEVVDALQAHDRGDATCDSERWRLERVGDRIDHKIKELQRTRGAIRQTLAACDAGRCRLSSLAHALPGPAAPLDRQHG
jgi:DNA-binding transcriptional MerR regulator